MAGTFEFKLPDVGEGVAEAEIVAWHVSVGDRVEEDQPLFDVMTDKATVEMEAPSAGLVTARYGEIGDMVAVGAVLVTLQLDGEGPAEPIAETPEVPAPARKQAGPATRRQAKTLGVDINEVPGTGPGGRVTPTDLKAYVARHQPAQERPQDRTAVHEVPIVGIRRKIAERMQDAKSRIPHFSYVEEFDLTELEALRKTLNVERKDDQPKLTFLPFFMKAMAKLQPEFPHINARFDDEDGVLRQYDGVHIGIATQTDAGLMVPVVRHVEGLDIWGCASEILNVTSQARAGKASREMLSGSTITLTSLGALGGIAATPVINSPEVAIIGPNKLVQRPVVQNGQVVVRDVMNLSSSFDHRIVDGHDAARYVQALKRLLEQPALLFV